MWPRTPGWEGQDGWRLATEWALSESTGAACWSTSSSVVAVADGCGAVVWAGGQTMRAW